MENFKAPVQNTLEYSFLLLYFFLYSFTLSGRQSRLNLISFTLQEGVQQTKTMSEVMHNVFR